MKVLGKIELIRTSYAIMDIMEFYNANNSDVTIYATIDGVNLYVTVYNKNNDSMSIRFSFEGSIFEGMIDFEKPISIIELLDCIFSNKVHISHTDRIYYINKI